MSVAASLDVSALISGVSTTAAAAAAAPTDAVEVTVIQTTAIDITVPTGTTSDEMAADAQGKALREALRREREVQLKAECPFAPKVDTRSAAIAGRAGGRAQADWGAGLLEGLGS